MSKLRISMNMVSGQKEDTNAITFNRNPVATNMSQLTIGTPLLVINGYSISYLAKLSTLPEHVAKQMASFELSTVDRQNSAASGMFKTFTELDIYYIIC